MKFNIEERAWLTKLGQHVSELLVKIAEEDILKDGIPTELDMQYQDVLSKIKTISPEFSDGYAALYNHIQKKKIVRDDNHYKNEKNRNFELI